MRILRLIENITLGTAAVGYLTESMHGAGSPQAQRIMISRTVNMKEKRKFRAFSIPINPEEKEMFRRLRCEYGINISRTVKLILQEKLEQLDKNKLAQK